MDWMLKDLAESVPQTRHVVVLSSDGLRMAQHGPDPDAADRLAAACAGLQSLAAAVGTELPYGDGRMRLVVIEMTGGSARLPRGAGRRGGGRRSDGPADARPGGQDRRAPRRAAQVRAARRRTGPMTEADDAWNEADPERLYVITSGRSGVDPAGARGAPLDLVSLIVARTPPAPQEQPEHAAILRLSASPLSVAELTAYLRLPFSVVSVLLTDLLNDHRIEARAPIPKALLPDIALLEAVMHGLQRL
jgi:hypothetical protein